MVKYLCLFLRKSFEPRSDTEKHFSLIPVAIAVVAVLAVPSPAYAYIGPGAGFAFLGSTAVFIVTFFLAILTIVFWPIQWLWRLIARKGVMRNARARRVVIVGLDGLEPSLVERYIEEGHLPNLKKLGKDGSYRRLGTTLPALSPVAWSTFQTGVNPGAHNIFDFLTRDKRFCLPLLSSTETGESSPGFFGRLLGKKKVSEVRLTRRSEPFWKILGRRGIFSNVIRVPISYPPEKCFGNVLSAMCTPDLRGTQGSFTLFTTGAAGEKQATSGEFQPLTKDGEALVGELKGPPDPRAPKGGELKLQFRLRIDVAGRKATLQLGDVTEELSLGSFSRWVTVKFPYKRGKGISGIARFSLRSIEPEVAVYVSPINVSPEEPALPIAAPIPFARWLARRIGLFGTLGLMEDTWGRNEHALDDRAFLEQTWLTHAEREAMFFEALERTREGVCVCVFDASDRIQHMFWRYEDPAHPSPREADPAFASAIPEMYRRMDALVGKVMAKLRSDDVLIILSDHGFSSFRRTVDLNRFLLDEGYLVLKDGAENAHEIPTLQHADWSKTRAFAVGLTGIYLNRRGRERHGIVEKRDAEGLKRELATKLERLRDPADGSAAIRNVYDSAREYRGLYRDEAPDLIVGFSPGYRVSWESVTGGVEREIFGNNMKAWSGDHHIDPAMIPGILFMNREVKTEAPHIIDIAPTVLNLFAVKVPSHMEGRVIA